MPAGTSVAAACNEAGCEKERQQFDELLPATCEQSIAG